MVGSVSVKERRERIARDDGDPEDEVIIGKTTRYAPAYHDPDADCRYLPDGELQTMTRERAHVRDLAPCTYCVLDDVERSEVDRSTYERLSDPDVTTWEEYREAANGGEQA